MAGFFLSLGKKEAGEDPGRLLGGDFLLREGKDWVLFVDNSDWTFTENGNSISLEKNGCKISIEKNGKKLFFLRREYSPQALYYALQENAFFLTSNPLLLLASGSLSLKVNWQAVWDFFTTYFLPIHSSMFEGVVQLPPGYEMTFYRETLKREIKRINFHPQEGSSLSQLVDFLLDSLRRFEGKKVVIGNGRSGEFLKEVLSARGAEVRITSLKVIPAREFARILSTSFELTGEVNAITHVLEDLLLTHQEGEKVVGTSGMFLIFAEGSFATAGQDGHPDEWWYKSWKGADFDTKSLLLAPVLRDFEISPEPTSRLLHRHVRSSASGLWTFLHEELVPAGFGFGKRAPSSKNIEFPFLHEDLLRISAEVPPEKRKKAFFGNQLLKAVAKEVSVRAPRTLKEEISDGFRTTVLEYMNSWVNIKQMEERRIFNAEEVKKLAEKAEKNDGAFKLLLAVICMDVFWKVLEKWV